MILVATTGRTGSSTVARILEEGLGVDMGGPAMVRPANPCGMYEDQRLDRIDEAFHLGRITEDEWAQAVQREAETRSEPWGYKNPRICLWLASWLALFPDARIVWLQRDPVDVARSWERIPRDPKPREFYLRRARERFDAIGSALRDRDHITIDMNEHRGEKWLAGQLRPLTRTEQRP